jgi:hypothetical protein
MRKIPENEKILLEIEGLKRTKKDPLKITAELNAAMLKILSQKIMAERKNLTKDEFLKELRNMTMRKER